MILFDRDGWRFNYRVAGVLIVDGRVLVEREIETGDCCLPGGRVELGESAAEAVVREMCEELGVELTVERLVWAVDNFFQLEDRRYHEVSFYFLLSMPEGTALPPGESFANQDNPRTVLEWRARDGLDDVPLHPTFLRTGLRSLPGEVVYMAHRDTPLEGIESGAEENAPGTMGLDETKCVVFDFAFTLCSDFFCKVTPPECPDWFYHFQRRIFCRHSPYMDDWMAGKLSSRDIAQIMTQYLPMPADRILAVMEDGCRHLAFNPAVFGLAQRQREHGRKTALVTANVDLFTNVVVPAHGLDRVFDVIVNTADHGELRKEHLWPVAFEKLGPGIGYHNSLLIEDGESMPRLFRELGGRAHQYTTDAAFIEWLAQGGAGT